MRPCKVVFKILVSIIVDVFVLVSTEVASEMLSAEVVIEYLVIEEVLLTEVTPWMRQDLSLPIVAWVSILNMIYTNQLTKKEYK